MFFDLTLGQLLAELVEGLNGLKLMIRNAHSKLRRMGDPPSPGPKAPQSRPDSPVATGARVHIPVLQRIL